MAPLIPIKIIRIIIIMLNKIYLEFSDIYKCAEYVILSSPPISFKVDQRSPDLDQLMLRYGVSTAGFITACNPHGIQQSDELNELAMNQLKLAIEELGLPYFSGFGKGPVGEWHEDSYLVMGMDSDFASKLGRFYQQNALVMLIKGQSPELVWLSE